MQYQVARHAATERAFTGKYWDHWADGQLPLRRLRHAAVRVRHQVRRRLRLAELLGAGQQPDVIERVRRHEPRHGAHRSALHQLRLAPRPRVRGRAAADRRALLHQLGGDRLRGPRARRHDADETAVRLPADHPVLRRLQVRRRPTRTGPPRSPPTTSASSSPAASSAPTKRRCCWPRWSSSSRRWRRSLWLLARGRKVDTDAVGQPRAGRRARRRDGLVPQRDLHQVEAERRCTGRWGSRSGSASCCCARTCCRR